MVPVFLPKVGMRCQVILKSRDDWCHLKKKRERDDFSTASNR